jgi:hypothetical protein
MRTNVHALNVIRTHGLSIQVIKAYSSSLVLKSDTNIGLERRELFHAVLESNINVCELWCFSVLRELLIEFGCKYIVNICV